MSPTMTDPKAAPPADADAATQIPWTFVQRAWRRLCRLATDTFYRRFEVSGLENLPTAGPVILCGNHVNALVDAVVVQSSCPRPIHPLARSGLFHNFLLRPVLRLIQAIPVYRRRRDPAAAHKAGRANEDSFRRCYEVLGEGRVLLIFPEGQSHSDPRMRELKTGAARIAIGSHETSGALPTVIPVGLTFTAKGRFRANVLVQYGEPVELMSIAGEEPRQTAHRFTAAIEQGLETVTLNLDSWEDLALLRLLQDFFTLRGGRRGQLSMTHRFRSLQSLIEAHRRMRTTRPVQVQLLTDKLRNFDRLCRSYGVRDYQLSLEYTPAVVMRFLLRTAAFLLFVVPPALWGALNSAVPYLAARQLARATARGRDQLDTGGMVFGMLFFSLFWGAQSYLVYHHLGTWPTIAYAASLPLTSGIALQVGRERRRILENVRVFFLFLRKRNLRGYLLLKRQELEMDLARLARAVRRDPSAA